MIIYRIDVIHTGVGSGWLLIDIVLEKRRVDVDTSLIPRIMFRPVGAVVDCPGPSA